MPIFTKSSSLWQKSFWQIEKFGENKAKIMGNFSKKLVKMQSHGWLEWCFVETFDNHKNFVLPAFQM